MRRNNQRVYRAVRSIVGTEIQASAGIDQKRAPELLLSPVSTAGLDHDMSVLVRELRHRPAFTNFRAALPRVFEQQMVKGRTLNLKRRRFLGVAPVAEDQF